MMQMKIDKILKLITRINFKTIYFNFKYLPFKKAIKLPVLINSNCKIIRLKGSVKINSEIKTGMISIGYGNIRIFDKKYSRTILDINGLLNFNGKARIGHGSKISISNNGELNLGNNFMISAESIIVCHKKITINNDTLISWGVQIVDTDFHSIYSDGIKINENKEVFIANKVWIGSNCSVLKGVKINANTVVASNTTLTSKSDFVGNIIIGGNPPRVLKNNIEWSL